MRELAAQYPRCGYRRIQVFLARRGHVMSADRTHRLWRLHGLQVPRKRPRRRVASSHGRLANLGCRLLSDLKRQRIVRPEFIVIADHRNGHAGYYGYAISDLAMLEAWLPAQSGVKSFVGDAQ